MTWSQVVAELSDFASTKETIVVDRQEHANKLYDKVRNRQGLSHREIGYLSAQQLSFCVQEVTSKPPNLPLLLSTLEVYEKQNV